MKEHMILMEVEGEFHPTFIEYKRRNRNMYLRVEEDGSIHVTCPYGVGEKDIQAFIYEKQDWILRTMRKQSTHVNHIKTGSDGKEATWLGKTYPVVFYSSKQSHMVVEENRIVFYLKTNTKKEVERIFYKEANKKLQELVEGFRVEWDWHICKEHFLAYPRIKYRYMVSQWGNCKPSRSEIVLSSRLIHFPVESLEYVLLHEYVHFLVPNHSKKFYNIVSKYMPEYKRYSGYLK